MDRQKLRPLGVGDIFDEGFDLYKRNFLFLLLAVAATVVPLDIGLALLTPQFMPPVLNLFGLTAGQSDAFSVWLVSSMVKLVFFLPLYAAALGPAAAAATARYLEQPVTLGSVFRHSLRRLPALLPTALLSGIGLALGLLLCGIPWLVAATLLLFVLQTVLTEGLGPVGAMRRSAVLAGGYGSRVFGCLLLLGSVLFVIGLGVRLPLAYLVGSVLNLTPGAESLYGGASGAGSAEEQVVSLISGGLAHLLLIPFLVCVVTVLYYDLRVRKEGVDVELMAQDLNYPPLGTLGPFLPPVPSFGPVLGSKVPVGRPPQDAGRPPQ